MTIHDALASLYPTSKWIIRGDVLEWSDDKPAPTQSEIDVEIERLQAEYDSKEYARNRATAYAPLGEQLDMQYHDSVTGSRTWLDHVEEIKARFPK